MVTVDASMPKTALEKVFTSIVNILAKHFIHTKISISWHKCK
jgi:hypothetical protein